MARSTDSTRGQGVKSRRRSAIGTSKAKRSDASVAAMVLRPAPLQVAATSRWTMRNDATGGFDSLVIRRKVSAVSEKCRFATTE
jgi:hypothetical protein